MDVQHEATTGRTGSSSHARRGATRRRIAPWLVAATLPMFCVSASAQMHATTIDPAAPRDAISITGNQPYAADPSFASGQYIEDAFASTQDQPDNNAFFEGKKVARMGNGDIVVAGLVKKPNGTSPVNGYWNIGLVRYNASGTLRLAWPNPNPAYAHFNNQYVVYPNNTETPNYDGIEAIQVVGDKIVVAASWRFNGTDDHDSIILVFGTDGSLKSRTDVGSNSALAENVGGMAAYRVGLPGTGTTSVVVALTQAIRPSVGGSIGRPKFRRYTLETNGSLTAQTGLVALDTHGCANITHDCRSVGIALTQPNLSLNPSIYVLNRAYVPNGNPGWAITVSKVTHEGIAAPDWTGERFRYYGGYSGGSSNLAYGIAVRTLGLGLPGSPYRDQIFVMSSIERACRDGILVVRLDDAGEAVKSEYFGGNNYASTCGLVPDAEHWPIAIALSGDRLAIAGYARHTVPLQTGGERITYNGAFAVVDITGTSTLDLLDFRDFPFPVSGSQDFRHTALRGITPTANGAFVVTGEIRFTDDAWVPPNLRGKTRVGTLGIAPFVVDSIFANGFD